MYSAPLSTLGVALPPPPPPPVELPPGLGWSLLPASALAAASTNEVRSPGRRVRFEARNLGREGEVEVVSSPAGEESEWVEEAEVEAVEVVEKVEEAIEPSEEEWVDVDSLGEAESRGAAGLGLGERALMVPLRSGGTARGSLAHASSCEDEDDAEDVLNALAPPPSRLRTTLLPSFGNALASSLARLAASSLATRAAALAPSGPVRLLLLFF